MQYLKADRHLKWWCIYARVPLQGVGNGGDMHSESDQNSNGLDEETFVHLGK